MPGSGKFDELASDRMGGSWLHSSLDFRRRVRGFTLLETVLVLTLVALMVSLGLVLMPNTLSIGETDAERVDRLVREAILHSLSERESTILETNLTRLELWAGLRLLREEDFGAPVEFVLADGISDVRRVVVSPDGFHEDFAVVVGTGEPFFYEASMSIR